MQAPPFLVTSTPETFRLAPIYSEEAFEGLASIGLSLNTSYSVTPKLSASLNQLFFPVSYLIRPNYSLSTSEGGFYVLGKVLHLSDSIQLRYFVNTWWVLRMKVDYQFYKVHLANETKVLNQFFSLGTTFNIL